MQVRKRQVFRQGLVAAAVAMLFQPGFAPANPVGPQVVNGSVSISQPNAATLNITNSPGAIINWQGFSIGVNEVTRFIQQSASSAVLNRVVGPDISAIQGQLQSNGRVFLINPAGIIVGPGAMIDTAGFVGSALNMSNADFLAGKLNFSGDATAGSVINQGWIRTPFGGNVLLVAPHIENSGLIETPGGELILAAGEKLTVSSLEQAGVQFEVQAPTDSVLNVGRLLADGGAVGVFAGSLRHSGEIRATTLARDTGGNIILKAAGDIQLAAGSVTSADGETGGTITIASGTGLSSIAGTVTATGSAGNGGSVTVVGQNVTAADGAVIDVSGSTGGGTIRLGGDFHGANAAVPNAANTFVGLATLRADATQKGDGGNIVVWSDDSTRYYGSLSAQGGPQGGNGGFAEVSGANQLLFQGGANLGAANGMMGGLLLDPLDLYVSSGGTFPSTRVDEASDLPSNVATISPATLAALTANVTLYASRYMRISSPVTLTNAGQTLTATVGAYAPAAPDPNALDAGNTPNRLDIAANITTNGGAVTLNAPLINSVGTVNIATTGGAIGLNSGGSLATGGLSLDAGAGAVTLTTGNTGFESIQMANVNGGTVTASAPGFVSLGAVSTGSGNLNLTSTGSSLSTGNITSTGGVVNLNAAKSSINTGGIKGGGGAVTLASQSGISTGTIDTTGAVALSATAGSIFATVDHAAKVTAAAAVNSAFSTATVNINSNTALNADTITATGSGCSGSTSCAGAQISLSAAGDITVGTVTATATATTNRAAVFNNSISRGVSISSNGGSILAAGPSSLITATDVTLSTQQGSGGGVGSAATALQVNSERLLSVAANGNFNVQAVGSGPSELNVQLGTAATGKTYSGTLSRNGGGMALSASATDSTVTVSNLDATGSEFTQRLYGGDPFVSLSVPNGALTLNTATISEGDIRPNNTSIFPNFISAGLPVSIAASGMLTVNNYTRQNTAASLPKTTAFSSSSGAVVLGTISGGRDSISVNASGSGAAGAVTVSSLTTSNNVSISANGDVTVSSIDTTGGAAGGVGNVSIFTNTGTIKAQADNSGLEINAGTSVNLSAKTIGSSGFAHPLDVKGPSVGLTSNGVAGGAIGFAGAPVLADTQNLTITAVQLGGTPTNGATFNVTTGATALTNLSVTADPQAVGSGGLATVTTEGGAGSYTFASDGTNFTFNAGKVPTANEFASGLLSFTANSGNVTLGNADMGASGSLAVTAYNGSILGSPTLDGGGSISLTAGQSINSATAVSVNVGNVGAGTRPSSLSITAGNFNLTRNGTVTVGKIEAGGVNITTWQGGITTLDIGDGARAGSVSLISNERSGTGAISTGKITASDLFLQDRLAAITTGDLDLSNSVNIRSENTMTLGSVTTPTLNIGGVFTSATPTVTLAAISGVQNLSISSNTTTITGSVTGDLAGTGSLFIGGASGVTINGGSVTAGDGSTITINSGGTKAFEFQTLNAGATGTVNVTSGSGIQQDAGGSGITGGTVGLSATNSGASVAQAGGKNLQLNSVQALTLNTSGPVMLDGGGAILNSLAITQSQAVTGASPFTLTNLGGGQTVTLAQSGANLGLTVASAAQPLNFSLNYAAAKSGVVLAGSGINSDGGNVSVAVSGGGFDGSVGGIVTGGGTVSLNAAGPVSTGAISTASAGSGAGGDISITTTGTTGTVAVNGNLTTGSGGGAININTQAAVTDVGAATLNADGGVTVNVFADGADIGSVAVPLLITSPTVTLSTNGNTLGGTAYATLSGTQTLSLSDDNGFSVASDTAFTTLGVATRGTGSGPLVLTAPGQSYTFARPATDLFGTALTNTLQVVTATGATTASFTARDGDLLVGGAGTNITAPTLTLATSSSTGDVKLQGTAANPLSLSETTQTVSAGRDVLVRGVVDLEGTTQSISAGRNVTVQADQGNVTIGGTNQTIQSTGFTTGSAISFRGGASANQTVTVTASNSQLIASPNSGSSASIQVLGGDGAGSSARILYTGSGTQTIESGGQVLVAGSDVGAGSIAEIRTATGSQYITSASSVNVTGGKASAAAARIVNTGSGSQQVGESSVFAAYRPLSIAVTGGAGIDAVAEITAAGTQSLQGATSGIVVQGGSGSNAFVRIDSTSASQQTIGCSSFSFCVITGSLAVSGGTGTGAYARVTNSGTQIITVSSQVGLSGGTASGTSASITGASQTIQGSAALTAGTGDGANALLQSAGSQSISGSATLKGGGGAGAIATAQVLAAANQNISGNAQLTGSGAAGGAARISSGGSQSISGGATLTGGSGQDARAEILQTSSSASQFIGGNVILTAGGSAGTPASGATARIEGNNQSISGSTISLTGGAGTATATSSDAVIRNLSGAQSVSGSVVTLTGGTQFSTTGIVNLGTDTQTINGSGGITLTAPAAALASAPVMIQNTSTAKQTLTASSGGLVLNNQGASAVTITTGGAQSVTAGYIDVVTAAGSSGDAKLTAAGSQVLLTRNGTTTRATGQGSMTVAARGTGTADIEAGSSQLIELDYPALMQGATVDGRLMLGDTAAAGVSRIGAVDQAVFAKSILIQTGGPTAGTRSELISTRTQAISVLNGNLEVRGGSGNNSLAQIDPTQQDITVIGNVFVVGGSGTNAVAQIVSAGAQNILATGDINVLGGSGAGSNALIAAAGQQTLSPGGLLNVQSNLSGGGDAFITFGSNSAGVSSSLVQNPATNVLALTNQQDEAIDDSAPQESPADTNPQGRVQICY